MMINNRDRAGSFDEVGESTFVIADGFDTDPITENNENNDSNSKMINTGMKDSNTLSEEKNIRDNQMQNNDEKQRFDSIPEAKKQNQIVVNNSNNNYISNDSINNNTSTIQSNPDVMKRNKRMFGALMGHLGLAKRKLEQDSSTGSIIHKQQQRAVEVTIKNDEESRRIKELRLRQERLLKKQATANLQIKDIKRANRMWMKVNLPLAKFLMTSDEDSENEKSKGLPGVEKVNVLRLAWLPVHHNQKTLQKLEKRRKKIEQQCRARDEADKLKCESLMNELHEEDDKKTDIHDAVEGGEIQEQDYEDEESEKQM